MSAISSVFCSVVFTHCSHVGFQAWMNEKFAPELLESKSEIVECVMEQLEHMVRVNLSLGCRGRES